LVAGWLAGLLACLLAGWLAGWLAGRTLAGLWPLAAACWPRAGRWGWPRAGLLWLLAGALAGCAPIQLPWCFELPAFGFGVWLAFAWPSGWRTGWLRSLGALSCLPLASTFGWPLLGLGLWLGLL